MATSAIDLVSSDELVTVLVFLDTLRTPLQFPPLKPAWLEDKVGEMGVHC